MFRRGARAGQLGRAAAKALLGTLAFGLPAASLAASPKTAPPPAATAAPSAAPVASGEPEEPPAAHGAGVDAIILPVQLLVERGRVPADMPSRKATIDGLLADTAQDLGLTVNIGERARTDGLELDEQSLVELAKRQGKLTVLPILRIGARERKDNLVELRVVLARPGSRALVARVERVAPEDLSVRAVVMLRDIVAEAGRKAEARETATPPPQLAEPAYSVGRAILAVNGTLYGGFLGYALERASGSNDPRLLYPLVGVGAGIGLGAAIIVADEWNVGVGDAWYLAAGAWWPAVASQLIYEGRFANTPSIADGEQWAFSLVASATGLGLSAVGLLRRGMGDGGAALAISGGGLGLIVGGLGELLATGSNEKVPLAGMGYGSMAGWLVGAATAIQIHPPASQVLSIDLGALLGTLGGAAAASPLLFGDTDAGKVRGWVGAAGAGMVAGAVLAWYLSSDEPAADEASGAESNAGGPSAVVVRWRMPTPTMLMPVASPHETEWADRIEASLGHGRAAPAPGAEWRVDLW